MFKRIYYKLNSILLYNLEKKLKEIFVPEVWYFKHLTTLDNNNWIHSILNQYIPTPSQFYSQSKHLQKSFNLSHRKILSGCKKKPGQIITNSRSGNNNSVLRLFNFLFFGFTIQQHVLYARSSHFICIWINFY